MLLRPKRRRANQEAATQRERRDALAGFVADGLLPASTARERLEELARRLAALEPALDSTLIGASELANPEGAWNDWTVPQRRRH